VTQSVSAVAVCGLWRYVSVTPVHLSVSPKKNVFNDWQL